MMTYLEDDDD